MASIDSIDFPKSLSKMPCILWLDYTGNYPQNRNNEYSKGKFANSPHYNLVITCEAKRQQQP